MSNTFRRCSCAFALLIAQSSVAYGESTLLSELDALTLDNAITKSLSSNPDLVASGFELEAARGHVEQAHLAPNPQLTVALEDALGSDAFSGFKSAETTISLAWVIESRIRERRVNAALDRESLMASDADILRLDVAAETARRFLDVLAVQAQITTANEAVNLAQDTILAVAKRVNAGRTPPADLARAEAELAAAQLIREDLDHELSAGRHRLAAQWGQVAPEFVTVQGKPLMLPETESFGALREYMLRTVDLTRYLSAERLAESELLLAQAESKPVWRASLGVRRFEATNDQALLGSVSIPLAIGNRNQGRIAETMAQVAQTRAKGTAARVHLETKLYVLYESLQHSLHRAGVLREQIIPRIESALSQTHDAYELGRYSYMEWATVQTELIDARCELIAASIDSHRHVIEIERLTGTRVAKLEESK
ncbi:MAG: TolC family protein [Proteobacteria bacterium]|nr:TolC family protein [Pseudomonadota bacterium]